MKIYTRDKFMELPEGTFYAKGKEWYFDGFNIKGKTLKYNNENIDFGYLSLIDIESRSSDQLIERFELMVHNNNSYPINNSGGRDGCFDPDELFLVYELEDLNKIKEYIEEFQI